MDGVGNRVDKALIGVRSKVDGNICAGSDGSSDFNVQHYLAVSVGAGRIRAAIYRDGSDVWLSDA